MKNIIFLFIATLITSSIAFAQFEFSPAPVGDEISVNNGSQYIYITNKSGSSQNLNLSLSQTGMSIASNRCNTLLANNRSCYIILSVNQNLLPSGITIADLNSNSVSLIKLKFSKSAPVESSEFSSTSITVSGFSTQTISIKNKTLSSKSYSPYFSGTDASKFEIVLNRCSNISPNVSCQITFRLKPQESGSYSAQLNDSLISVPATISATIAANAPGSILPVVKSVSLSTSSLNFGTLIRYGMSSPINVVITNTGNATVSPILNFSSKMGLVLNRCSTILSGQSCSISIGINPDSSMANGPILGQSVGIKAYSADTEQVISVSANLNVINVSSCSSNQHLELGVCVSNTRSCSISNGTGSQTWSSNTWGSCVVSSCDSGYYDNFGSSCNLITYSSTYSSYSPNPLSILACEGVVNSTRSIVSCMRDDNFSFVDISNCSDSQPSISTNSPAGTINVSISNGSESRSCLEGSTVQNLISRSCNGGFHDDGNSCAIDTYYPSLSGYTPEILTNLQACDGTIVSNRSILECRRQHDNQLVSNVFCSDPLASVSTLSPAGNINVSISNGSESRSCAEGSSSQSFVSRSCDSGFNDNGSSCVENIYIASFNSYSPAIPSNLQVCDGTVVSNRTIDECRQQHDNQLVANSFCSDPAPSVSTLSPSGNVNSSISNGSETYSCIEGSSSQSFVSRSCDSGYYNDGAACSLISYVPTYSSYSPAVPSSMNVCDGTVTSTRSITDCIQSHDSLSVSTSLCSDPSPSVVSQSPAGDLNVSISNGSETLNCALGSSTQTLVSRTCNSGYIDNGSICDPEIKFVSLGLNINGVLKNNNAYLWGTDGWGALGNNTTGPSATPVQPSTSGVLSGKTLSSITLGNKVLNRNFMCSIASDGLPYCWGAGTSGGLGNGGTSNSSVPVAVTTSGVLAGKTMLKIVNSAQSACVIASDSKVYCWGRNNEGQLGIGSTTPTSSSVPVAITGGLASKNAVEMYMSGSGSTSFTYVLTSDGQLFNWGDNTNGQLCRGGSFSTTPTVINTSGLLAGKTITNVVLAGNSTFIQTSDGKAYACGANSIGQLGINSATTSVTTITELSTANFAGKTIKKLSSASTFGCLINSDDLPFCWGQNLSGKTGLNLTSGNTLLPTAVILTGDMASKTYIDIETNGAASYFLSSDKKLYSSGGGFGGVLGNGGTTDVAVPGPIAGTLNTLLINKIYAGFNQACALTSLNKLYCWGTGNMNGTSSGVVSTPALVNIP